MTRGAPWTRNPSARAAVSHRPIDVFHARHRLGHLILLAIAGPEVAEHRKLQRSFLIRQWRDGRRPALLPQPLPLPRLGGKLIDTAPSYGNAETVVSTSSPLIRTLMRAWR